MIPRKTLDDIVVFSLGTLFALSIFLVSALDGWKPFIISLFITSTVLISMVDRAWKHIDAEHESEDVE